MYSIKCPYDMKPEYITIHNTANKASALNEYNYAFINSGKNKQTGWHMTIDDIEAIQAIPFNRNSWHAGDGNSGVGNRKSIGIEICYSTDYTTDRFYKAIENTIDIVKQLMQQYNIPIENIKQHKYWSGKNCPHRMIEEKLWDGFLMKLKEVKEENKMLKEGYQKIIYNGQEIHVYKQNIDEEIGLVSTDKWKETKTIDKFTLEGKEITAAINASYFENRNNLNYGQVYGREQSFTKDERPDQKEYLDFVITSDNNFEIGNFSSWEWEKPYVKLGCSQAVTILRDGYTVEEYSAAVGKGKVSTANTQTLLMKDKTSFYFAVVSGKLNAYGCRQFARAYGMVDAVMLDSGGSSQMMVKGSKAVYTGRKIPNVLVFYKSAKDTSIIEETPTTNIEVKPIGKVHVHRIGLNIRSSLNFNRKKTIASIVGFVNANESIELVDFVPGLQNDGFQWVIVKHGKGIAYCQYDSNCYTIEIYK